jgi:flagellar hook-associated protein 2
MDLGISGLVSGFDWRSFIDQMTEVERAPQNLLKTEQSKIQQQKDAYSKIRSQLESLKSRASALADPTLFQSRSVSVSDSSVARASVTSGVLTGSFSFNIIQLATSASQQGGVNVGASLSATDITASSPEPDTSPVVTSAAFPVQVTAGTFTINGKQVTIESGDTLRQVFQKISDATGGEVTASYDAAADKITLSSSNVINLGSSNDTSNFLEAARLYFNNSGTVTSSTRLGSIKLNSVLSSANFSTTISDGGSGNGEFKINGVSIQFNASTDTVSDVISRINNSSAGVFAYYDSNSDRFILTNKLTGDRGIALEDVTGNFLEATKLLSSSGGTLSRGNNLLYTVNGGDQQSSLSNTITEANMSIPGLTLTALKTGTVNVQIDNNTDAVKNALASFIEEYNKVQSLIDNYTASSTDSSGKVTAGILAADGDANEIARKLRTLATSSLSGLSGTIIRLEQLGYTSSGDNDSLTLTNGTALDNALSQNLSAVKDFFTNESDGFIKYFNDYLDKLIGDDGSLLNKDLSLTNQVKSIDDQISSMERIVQQTREQMIASFTAMEQAQSRINQQLQYLLQQFGSK